MRKAKDKPDEFPQQQQAQPGDEYKMVPQPEYIRESYKGSGKLEGKVAIITGGDSGIGRAVAVHFAREGADISILYLSENKDAEKTKELVEAEGKECLVIRGDVGDRKFCENAVEQTVNRFGKLNILVNNAGQQYPVDEFKDIDLDTVDETFKTNILSMFYITVPALKYLSDGDTIINTTSVTQYRGSGHLVDYSSTKGAITAFTRSLSKNLAGKKIRVNGVAPGPIWTPLIPASFDDVTEFGQKTMLGRAGQPSEVAPAYVFLASIDASFITGQIIHVNGGDFISS